MNFKNVSVVCEGQTEERFVKYLSKAYFNAKEISLKPVIVNKVGSMEGNVSIDRVVDYIKKAEGEIVTTLVDYYGFKDQGGRTAQQIEHIIKEKAERAFLIPYLQMHETEALWFSNIDSIKDAKQADTHQYENLQAIIAEYPNPEDINNSPQTAPSKRLKTIFKDYQKILDGELIFKRISIEEMKAKCPKFSSWLDSIEEMVNRLRGSNG